VLIASVSTLYNLYKTYIQYHYNNATPIFCHIVLSFTRNLSSLDARYGRESLRRGLEPQLVGDSLKDVTLAMGVVTRSFMKIVKMLSSIE